MSEEETKSVEELVPAAAAPATESESEHNERPDKAKEAEQRKRNDVEHNWAESRRKMQELEKQNRDMQEQISRISPKPAPEEDDLSKLAEDDILTVAQARKLATKMARSVAEEVVKQREAATVEERVQLKYPDFADVVSKENIELLKQTEPELAMSLYHIPDAHAQAVAAYKLIKKVGLSKPEVNTVEKKKATENSQKPMSVQAVAKTSAIGNAHLFENGLTPELKKQLWSEMQQASKQA